MRSITKQYSLYERTVTWTLMFFVAVALLAYCYFLTLSVFAVVERNHAERKIEEAKGHLALREKEYAELRQKITLAVAKERGFIEVATPAYLSLMPEKNVGSLSVRTR